MLRDMDPIKEIATVIAAVANDSTLSVKLDEKGAAFIDFKTKRITLSDKVIPKAYRVHPELRRIFRLALAQHEAQHWFFMHDCVDKFIQWKETRRYPELAQMAMNIVEDYRVNTWLVETYTYDIGQRITFLNELFLKAWKPQIEKMLVKSQKEKGQDFLRRPVNFVVHASIQCAILGVEASDFADTWAMHSGWYPTDDSIESVKRVCALVEEGKYTPQDTVMSLWEGVYRVFERYSQEEWEKKGDGSGECTKKYVTMGEGPGIDMTKVPVMFGGSCEVEGEKGDALKEAQKLDKEMADSKGDEYQSHAGIGQGLQAPTPKHDEGRYSQLVQRNRPYITALLNKLKTLMQPKLETKKFQKSGRLMSKYLGKYVTSRRPVEYIYSRKKYTLEERKVSMSLVVDLSGSMDTDAARDVLTTISEVGGAWLNDEDFAIFVFGSSWQKVKSFDEPYRNTRARIGGVHNLGGTVLASCLHHNHQMFGMVGEGRQRLCIIVSDFQLGDSEQVRKVMAEMRKDDIRFIGVGMCSGDLNMVKTYVRENSTYINNISELPTLFYQIYRKAVSDAT